MNSYQKLQEYHPSFRSLNVSDSEGEQLTPLFDYILNGLESYENEIQKAGTQLADFKEMRIPAKTATYSGNNFTTYTFIQFPC